VVHAVRGSAVAVTLATEAATLVDRVLDALDGGTEMSPQERHDCRVAAREIRRAAAEAQRVLARFHALTTGPTPPIDTRGSR
jgi:hypothetical protein